MGRWVSRRSCESACKRPRVWPPRTDKDGVWVPENVAIAPRLVARAQEPGANIGRCRVIELQPNTYADAVYNLHRDDNNRLNPEGTGWIVRAFFNLTDNPDAMMILREEKDDPSTETRIPLPAGAQVVIDTQRLYHAVSERLQSFADRVSERVDACNAAIDAAQVELEDASAELRERAVEDIRGLVRERTEARKAGIFG